MKLMFTWIEAHQAIANKLLGYNNNQQGLIDILKQAGIDKFDDEVIKGIKSPLAEIDPFTFFSYIYKHGPLNNKKYLRAICGLMGIDIDVKDVCGVPSTNAQNVWYFPYKYDRNNNELGRLWNFFDKLLANSINDEDFQDILSINRVGKAKLVDGMYRIKPYDYLCFNGVVNPYLRNKKGINPDFTTHTELQILQKKVLEELKIDFPTLSYNALLDAYYADYKPGYFRIGTTEGESGPSVLTEMVENNVVSIGWADLGDIEYIDPLTKTGILNKLLQNKSYDAKNVASRKAGEILTFYEGIKVNDYVLASDGANILAIGKIVSENYFFEPSFNFPHCRNVEWIKTTVNDLQLNEGLRTSVWQYEHPESIKVIESYLGLVSTATIPGPPIEPEKPQVALTILPQFPLNTILFGPPGTGKTYKTIDKAVEIINGTNGNHTQNKPVFDELRVAGRIAFVTFHQNYTYEDFMVGIKPQIGDNSTSLQFRNHEGIFYTIVKKAKKAYESTPEKQYADRYVLIIDEINRANISRVFGELITLLEDDKRLDADNELTVTLPNGEDFSIPPNLFIVGTMNTADKSISLIDIALRRRFEFIGFYPDPSVLAGRFSERISFLNTINKNIYQKRKSADYLIGHAYLLKDGLMEDIIEAKIIPLLMEYFGGRVEDVAAMFEGSGHKASYDDNNYKWIIDLNPISSENP